MFSDIFFYMILSVSIIALLHYIYDFIFNKVVLDKPKPLHPILIDSKNKNTEKNNEKNVTFMEDNKETEQDNKEKIKQDLKEYIKGLSHKQPKLSKTSDVDVNIASKMPKETAQKVGEAFFNNQKDNLLTSQQEMDAFSHPNSIHQSGKEATNINEPMAADNGGGLFASF